MPGAGPAKTTITVDGNKFDSLSTSVSFTTPSTGSGVAEMGGLVTNVHTVVDMNDSVNMPYATLNALFTLANVANNQKIKAVKIDFWKDDAKQDVLCSYQFNGWVSRFETTHGGQGSNQLLVLELQPVITDQQFGAIQMTN